MGPRSRTLAVVVVMAASTLVTAACGSKGEQQANSPSGPGSIAIGASMSLTGQLAREGALTKEGYELCQDKVNAAGGADIGGQKVKLRHPVPGRHVQAGHGRPARRPVQRQGRQADPQLLRVRQHGGSGCGGRAQRPGDGRLRRRGQQDLREGLSADVRRAVPGNRVRGVASSKRSRSSPRRNRRRWRSSPPTTASRRPSPRAGWPRPRLGLQRRRHGVLPQRHLGRQRLVDQGQGEQAGRHHRFGSPGRGRRDHQAGQGARRRSIGRVRARRWRPRRQTSPRPSEPDAENVLGSSQWTDSTKGS